MPTLRDYKDDLGQLAEILAHPDVELQIIDVAGRHGKTEQEVYKDLRSGYPVHWAQAKGADERRPLDGTVENLIDTFGVTDDDVANIRETDHLYKQVLPRGHLISVAGLPGAGKTTIFEYIAGKVPETVLYINADISAGDVPEAQRRAKAGGYHLLCPDIKVGLSIDDVVKMLERLAAGDEDLSNTVLIFDTLKKITEVISKVSASSTYKLLRSLTGRGATVICLSHCNKYPDADGWPVYEGTSDLRSDFDELGLLHAHKGSYGQVIVSLYWDEQGLPWGKTRAILQTQSWIIERDDNRAVDELDEWVDTVAESKEFREQLQTSDVIREIYNLLLKHGGMSQAEILERLAGIHGQHVVRRVLKRQQGKTWNIKTGDNNKHIHTAIPDADIPGPKVRDWGQDSKHRHRT